MIFNDNDVIRLKRQVTADGWTTGKQYQFAAGTLGAVVSPGDSDCQVEFVVKTPDGGIECTIAAIGVADAEVVPRSEWSRL